MLFLCLSYLCFIICCLVVCFRCVVVFLVSGYGVVLCFVFLRVVVFCVFLVFD